MLTEAVSANLFESSGILAFYQIISFASQEGYGYICDTKQSHCRSILLQSCQVAQVEVHSNYSFTKHPAVPGAEMFFKGSQLRIQGLAIIFS